MPPGPFERLLRDVLGQPRVAHHRDRDGEHLALEPAHERHRDLVVTETEAGQQSLVGEPVDGDAHPVHILGTVPGRQGIAAIRFGHWSVPTACDDW